MKRFNTYKWFSQFNFDWNKDSKHELCSTKIADMEQIQDETQQKLVESPPVCNGRIGLWLRLMFHYHNCRIKLNQINFSYSIHCVVNV